MSWRGGWSTSSGSGSDQEIGGRPLPVSGGREQDRTSRRLQSTRSLASPRALEPTKPELPSRCGVFGSKLGDFPVMLRALVCVVSGRERFIVYYTVHCLRALVTVTSYHHTVLLLYRTVFRKPCTRYNSS